MGRFKANVVVLMGLVAVGSFCVDSSWGFGENRNCNCGLPDHWPSVPAGKEGSTEHGRCLRCQASPL